MFKRLAITTLFLATAASTAVPAVSAADSAPLEVAATRQFSVGVDRIFEFDVANTSARDVIAHGRAALLNVYDTSLPIIIDVPDVRVPASGTTTVGIRLSDAPLAGQIRALLVLNDGQGFSLVQSFDFWFFPLEQASLFVGLSALSAALALSALRMPKYFKTRVPSGMLSYMAEEDDTVATLSSRFDVTWQDIVRANRLRPPYALKPGRRILIPKHDLRRHETNS